MNDNGRQTGTSLDVWFYVRAAFDRPEGVRLFDADEAPTPSGAWRTTHDASLR